MVIADGRWQISSVPSQSGSLSGTTRPLRSSAILRMKHTKTDPRDGGQGGEGPMAKLRRAVRREFEQWKRLAYLLVGKHIEPTLPQDGIDMIDHSEPCEGCPACVSSQARSETERRSFEAERALRSIRSKFHEADQPMTVARMKASMLKRVARGG
jgi:hypothetical protein